MINIIQKSRDFDKRETYKMTLAQDIEKVSDNVGEVVDVSGYLIFEDVKEDGETVKVCTVLDKDGRVFATNSETFIRNLQDIAGIFEGEEFSVKFASGVSKNGRSFMYCTLE